MPSVKDIADCDLLGIPVDLIDHEILNSPLQRTIKREDVSRLRETLSSAFVSEKRRAGNTTGRHNHNACSNAVLELEWAERPVEG